MSILHIIFDMLAFKATCTHHLHYGLCDPLWQNDIQFWRNNKSLQGLSLQKIRTDVVVSVIAASQHVACCSLYSDIAPLSQCVTVCAACDSVCAGDHFLIPSGQRYVFARVGLLWGGIAD